MYAISIDPKFLLFGLFCLASPAQASENIWTIDSAACRFPAAASGALSSLANLRPPASPPAASTRPAISNGEHSSMQPMRPGCAFRIAGTGVQGQHREGEIRGVSVYGSPRSIRQKIRIECSFTSMAALCAGRR